MRRAIYLDFSLPLFEKDSNLKGFSSNLKDLVRYISKTKNTKFYVSLTLDFVTTFKSEIEPLSQALKELYKEERVEFVVKDSFDVNSLNYPRNISEFNYILNEYLIGFYFGDKRNFEGDPSILVKDLVNISPYKNNLTIEDYKFLKGMGYSTFLLDKDFLGDSSFIFDNSIFIKVDFEFSKLFSSYVEKEVLDNYLLSDISNNFMVYHINPYKFYLNNPESFNINASNLFHLIDLSDKVEYRLADEAFEMPVIKDFKFNHISSSQDELFNYQYNLAKFMKLDLPENFDLSIFEDLRTVSLWEGTGNKLIDEYLRTSFLMITLLSGSINSKIKLLNKHLVSHLSIILDELESYSRNNHDFKSAIQNYRSFINQN
jgi:hypothetical protein